MSEGDRRRVIILAALALLIGILLVFVDITPEPVDDFESQGSGMTRFIGIGCLAIAAGLIAWLVRDKGPGGRDG